MMIDDYEGLAGFLDLALPFAELLKRVRVHRDE
jgi:hypothetical protein